MTIWIVFSLMAVLAAVGTAIPLIRRYDAAAQEGDTITSVIRSQLAEIEGQIVSGQVARGDAEALRTELKRRLLVERRAQPLAVRLLSDRATARLSLMLAAAMALVATGTYAVDGRPDLTGPAPSGVVAAEVAAATGSATPADAGVATMIPQLEARTKQDSGDVDGWRLLAAAYFGDQRFADAAVAYGRAVLIKPQDATLHSAQGEALTQAAGGIVTAPAASAFTTARSLDAKDPRARYFLALARDQHGDHVAAIDAWVALLNDAPPGAPWVPELRRFVEQAARDAKIDLAGRLSPDVPIIAGAANARGPDAAAVGAASTMSPDARAAFIRGMVDNLAAKLAANPHDADGWIRLIRARAVMGDMAAAQAALAKGRAAFADQPATAQSISVAAAGLGVR